MSETSQVKMRNVMQWNSSMNQVHARAQILGRIEDDGYVENGVDHRKIRKHGENTVNINRRFSPGYSLCFDPVGNADIVFFSDCKTFDLAAVIAGEKPLNRGSVFIPFFVRHMIQRIF
jgi:hypothetical protein